MSLAVSSWSRAFLWLVSVERLRRPLIAFDDCREWYAICERLKKLVYRFVDQLRRPNRKFRQSWKSGGRIMRSSGSALIYLRASSAPLSAWSYGVAVKLIVTGVPEVPVAFVPLNGVATSVWLPAAGLHAV